MCLFTAAFKGCRVQCSYKNLMNALHVSFVFLEEKLLNLKGVCSVKFLYVSINMKGKSWQHIKYKVVRDSYAPWQWKIWQVNTEQIMCCGQLGVIFNDCEMC